MVAADRRAKQRGKYKFKDILSAIKEKS